MLIRVEDKRLSFDLNGDGKFQGADEVFASCDEGKGTKIYDQDMTTTYVFQRAGEYKDDDSERYMFYITIKGDINYQQYCDIGWSSDPLTAPSAQFHAPLTIALTRPLDLKRSNQTLRRGGNPADIRVNISTIDQKTGCWVVVRTDEMFKPGHSVFPTGVHPFLDAEFPSKVPGHAPIKQRYPLDKTCCGSLFHGLVDVPDGIGDGKVKLTVSFDAWPAGRVAPSTSEVTLEAAKE